MNKMLYIFLFVLLGAFYIYKKDFILKANSSSMENFELKDSYNLIINEEKDLENLKIKLIENAEKDLQEILHINVNYLIEKEFSEERIFDLTFGALDKIFFSLGKTSAYSLRSLMGTDDIDLKNKLMHYIQFFSNWSNENISYNKKLYLVLKDASKILLHTSKDKSLFIKKIIKDFERSGILLSEDKQNRLKEINEKITELYLKYEKKVQEDSKKVLYATKDDLVGLSDQDLEKFDKNSNDEYIIGVDYTTSDTIISYCKNRELRKKFYCLFNSRGYPENYEIINKARVLMQEYADILGYKNIAEYEVENEMAKSVDNVTSFLKELDAKKREQAISEKNEFQKFGKELLKDEEDKFIHAYDSAYIAEKYKNSYLSYDSKEISKYFTTENTVKELINVYSEFFNIKIKEIKTNKKVKNIDENIKTLELKDCNNNIMGHILLDIYCRPGKNPHPCNSGFISAVKDEEGNLKELPITFVFANFQKETLNNPSLMKFSDVETLFHEIGHAMHDVLGATNLHSQAGTSTARDFVEIPSQLFENWMLNTEVLKKVSSHYQTKKPLTNELIKKIQDMDNYNKGLFYERQIYLSEAALLIFTTNQDTSSILFDTRKKYIMSTDYNEFDFNNNHLICNWIHLFGYGSRYYSYMWSLGYADKINDFIQKNDGYLDCNIGKKLYECILSKGSSEEYQIMIDNFLND